MKKWKKYAFLVMVVVSGIVYQAGTLIIRAAGASNREWEAREKNLMQKGSIGLSVAEAGIADDILRELLVLSEDRKPADQNTGEGTVSDDSLAEDSLFHRVEMDYLGGDALFIGDSRTSTLYEYAGWDETDFFVKNGLTIWDVWERTMDGRTLADVLSAKQYKKIYIMLGINELGNETAEGYREEYESVLAKLKELQPGAIIFV